MFVCIYSHCLLTDKILQIIIQYFNSLIIQHNAEVTTLLQIKNNIKYHFCGATLVVPSLKIQFQLKTAGGHLDSTKGALGRYLILGATLFMELQRHYVIL